jgi:hypothetical protein
MVAFNAIAQLHLDGRASAYWVVQTVVEIAEPDFPRSITKLPLGELYLLEDEWGAGRGRTEAQLCDVVRKACLTQLERSRRSQLARAELAPSRWNARLTSSIDPGCEWPFAFRSSRIIPPPRNAPTDNRVHPF